MASRESKEWADDIERQTLFVMDEGTTFPDPYVLPESWRKRVLYFGCPWDCSNYLDPPADEPHVVEGK